MLRSLCNVRRLTMMACLLLAPTVPLLAQAVEGRVFRIADPKDGDTVKGIVDVKVPNGAVPEGGYVSFALDSPDKFQFATIPSVQDGLFKWSWDTQATKEDGKTRLFTEGKHTIYAVAHDALGKELENGVAQVVVNVANTVKQEFGAFHLAYKLNVGDDSLYQARYRLKASVPNYGGFVPKVSGLLIWETHVDDLDPSNALAFLHSTFQRVSAEDVQVISDGRETEAWDATFFSTMFQLRDADYVLSDKGTLYNRGRKGGYHWSRNSLAEETIIPLPQNDVNIGDTWEGPLEIWTVAAPTYHTAVGSSKNKFEDVEWVGTTMTAKIHTSYSITLPTHEQMDEVTASAAGGGSGGSGGAPAGGAGSKFSRTKDSTTKVEYAPLHGERETWFDFATGRVLVVHDVRHIDNLPKEYAQFGKGGGGGGGGGGLGGGGGGGGAGGANGPDVDMSWLTGFDLTNDAAVLAAMQKATGASTNQPAGGAPMGVLGGLIGQLLSGAPGGQPTTPATAVEVPPPPYDETFDVNLVPDAEMLQFLDRERPAA